MTKQLNSFIIAYCTERFPSGQRGQTVNLLSQTSMVRIHLSPPSAGIVQWQNTSFPSWLCGFDSRCPLHCQIYAHVAQQVEHFLGKEEVRRFNPARELHYFLRHTRVSLLELCCGIRELPGGSLLISEYIDSRDQSRLYM